MGRCSHRHQSQVIFGGSSNETRRMTISHHWDTSTPSSRPTSLLECWWLFFWYLKQCSGLQLQILARAQSLTPPLAISSRARLLLLSMSTTASVDIKPRCRRDKKPWWSVLFLFLWREILLEKNQNKAPGYRRHGTSTTGSEGSWIIQNMLINTSTGMFL